MITDRSLSTEEGRTKGTYEIEMPFRTLLVQMVFKNYQQEIVIGHLKSWFLNESFIGKSDLFQKGSEIAVMFTNCVYDQLVQETAELGDEQLVAHALSISNLLFDNKDRLVKIFQTRKRLGLTYEVDDLVMMSKAKFAITLLVRFTHNFEAFETFETIQYFDMFNDRMREIVVGVEQNTKTLANYLIKEFVRKHGSSSLNFIMSNSKLNWITPKSLVGEERVT